MAPKFTCFFLALILFFWIQPFISHSRILNSGGQAFMFLEKMDQVQKGQTVDGLNSVKRYLSRFGYYPSDTDLNDDFDDMFEFALKTYQTYHNLKVTGRLDSGTMKSLTTPRCGVPDIANNTYTKPSNEGTSMFVSVSHYSFRGKKWSPFNYDMTYNFDALDFVKGILSEQELRSAFFNAFKSWENASQFTFNEVPDGSLANIVIGFFEGDHNDGNPFDGPGGVLAHSFPDGRIHYDAAENWSTNPLTNQMDLQSVVVHEIGHLLGLGHSRDTTAVMYAGIAPGTIKRELSQDDIDGIQALYNNHSWTYSIGEGGPVFYFSKNLCKISR